MGRGRSLHSRGW